MVGIPNHRRGPSRNQLLCLKLNFAAVKAPYLTPTQLDAMELQLKIAVKDTYEVIHGSARAAAALAPAEAAAASDPPPPVSWAAGALKLSAARPQPLPKLLLRPSRGSARSSPSASFC